MMKYLEDQYEGQYYGYCNGDLLIDSSLIQLLTYIHSQQQQHTFLPHVFSFLLFINHRFFLLVVVQTSLLLFQLSLHQDKQMIIPFIKQVDKVYYFKQTLKIILYSQSIVLIGKKLNLLLLVDLDMIII